MARSLRFCRLGGQHEATMITAIPRAVMQAPLVSGSPNDTDTEIALKENLEGLQKILGIYADIYLERDGERAGPTT